MSWFTGTDAEKGLGVVFKLFEHFPARSALVPGISSGSGETAQDSTSNQRKIGYNVQGPELSERDRKCLCTV
jgi:hypothetical protein